MLLAAIAATVPPRLSAQAASTTARTLSLEEAVRKAEGASETVGIARAGVTRANGELRQARSELFPQLSGTASYTRALASEFEGLSLGPPDDRPFCQPFLPPSSALTADQRLDSLEAGLQLTSDCQADSGFDFSNLPFGRRNTWRLGLNATQTIFSGGRVFAQSHAAEATRRTAEIGLTSARAELVLTVVQSYYDAALADRLLDIAQATLQQAETTLSQTRLARQVGTQPEFDLLRAQVTRDNQRPVVVRARTDRDLAYLQLKQLLDVPLDEPLHLTTQLGDTVVEVARLTGLDASGDTSTSGRAPVRQANQAVEARENLLTSAKSQRLPSISISSQYDRVGYPSGGLPSWSDFRSNWNVGVSLALPIFTGGRISGQILSAQADLSEQRLRLEQTRELAQLDTRNALAQLEAAQAQMSASGGTVEQAVRAYNIAEIRYREGISTQTELADSRILLQQAQANRAMAARDLAVARARVALLPDLPLGAGGMNSSAAAAAARAAGAGAGAGVLPGASPAPRRTSTSASAQAGQTSSAGTTFP
jgi:outer membrane protein TolC